MSIILNYGGDTITLNNLAIGDSRSIKTPTINRLSLGGKLLYDHKTEKRIIRTFSFTFQALTETEKNDLVTFLTNYLGYAITLTDEDDIVWYGVIATNVFNFIIHRDTCTYSISFDFLCRSLISGYFNLITEDDVKIYTEDNHQLVTGYSG